MLTVALALGLAADTRLDTIDRRIAADRAALASTEAPVVRLLATIQRLLLSPPDAARNEALQRDAALLRVTQPAISGRVHLLRQRIDALGADRAERVVRVSLRRRGVRASPVAHVVPVPPCDDGPFRAPIEGPGLTARAAAALERPRGLTLVALPDASVMAPAGGRIAYAGMFRRYGGVVILDHGHGWTTLLTGLDRVTARMNGMAAAGEQLGSVGRTEPLVTVELSHHGRAVDPRAMLRRCSGERAGARPFPPAPRSPT